MKKNKWLYIIIATGFLLRILFMIKGATIYYGEGKEYTNGDSFSYSGAFIHLVETGNYTFDPENETADMGRLPGYPFFWGIFYLLAGEEYVYPVVAFAQIILDCIGILLVYLIVLALTENRKTSLLCAVIYACYPFIIIWNTITGTESLATFCTLFFLWWMTTRKTTGKNVFITGIIIAVSFYVRPYLGVFLAVSWLHLWMTYRHSFGEWVKKCFLVSFAFGILYLPWPVRNYINHGEIIPTYTVDTGYDCYAIDVFYCREWIYCFSQDADFYLDKIAKDTTRVEIPDGVFSDENEQKQFDSLVGLSRTCGTGFYNWKTYEKYKGESCNKEISEGFISLKKSFIKNHPVTFFIKMPLINLSKALFKTTLTSEEGMTGTKKLAVRTLFIYRSLLILLGICAVFLLPKKWRWVYVFFPLFMYLYISGYLRQIEMRYLLQADIVMIIIAGVTVGGAIKKLG